MLFEKAVRTKLRFPFRGQCSAEDLWDVSVQDLDAIYKGLSREAKSHDEESLLDEKSVENETLALQISVIKRVVKVKLAEQKARENAMLNAARKQKILGIIETKQDAELHDLDVGKLQELVDSLD